MSNYLNLTYQNSFTPTVNTPPRVTRKTSIIIDHILTNSFVNTNFKTFIFKIDISDHFPICFLLHILPKESSTIAQSNCLNKNYIKPVVINNKNPNDGYNYISHKLIDLYDKYFPKQNIRIYKKDLQSLWITIGIKKSSKLMRKILM